MTWQPVNSCAERELLDALWWDDVTAGRKRKVTEDEFLMVLDLLHQHKGFVEIGLALREKSGFHVGQAVTVTKCILHWLRENGTGFERVRAAGLLAPFGLTERGYGLRNDA